MSKIVVLGTPIANRWLNNHCEVIKFTSEDGSMLLKPKIVSKEDFIIQVPDRDVVVEEKIQLNRYRMISEDGSNNYVKQYVQSSYIKNNNLYVKTGLIFESTGKKIFCSLHGYIPNRINK